MLARIRKMQEENEGGFTLIELLVVMIIIGILAAIAIPLFLNQRKNAVDASIKSDLRTVANEFESVYTDSQSYPATLAQAGTTVTITDVNAGTRNDRVSPNVVVHAWLNAAAASATAYCLQGSAPNKASHAWVYESDNGGLQPSTTVACPAAYGTAIG